MQFVPGRPLFEQVAEYEVSETVIRYVMIRLKTQGLVYGQPGKGVYVTASAPE